MDILCSPEFPFITETLLFAHRIGNQKCEVTSPLSQSTINPYLPNPGVEQWLCGSEEEKSCHVSCHSLTTCSGRAVFCLTNFP